ncbi:uncharacterized protein LOC143026533 isoform X2 [Oratosquilla oratoria]|uniref:uncharacterized protein LOC143026533 isoform X2 n=1 Tax=Oratosquilla oratoria TaxID=337810 RepID=UPI003F762D1A
MFPNDLEKLAQENTGGLSSSTMSKKLSTILRSREKFITPTESVLLEEEEEVGRTTVRTRSPVVVFGRANSIKCVNQEISVLTSKHERSRTSPEVLVLGSESESSKTSGPVDLSSNHARISPEGCSHWIHPSVDPWKSPGRPDPCTQGPPHASGSPGGRFSCREELWQQPDSQVPENSFRDLVHLDERLLPSYTSVNSAHDSVRRSNGIRSSQFLRSMGRTSPESDEDTLERMECTTWYEEEFTRRAGAGSSKREPEEIEDVRRHVMPQMVEDTPSTRSFPQLKNPSKAYKSSFLSELVKDEDEEQHEQSEDLTVSIGLTTHKYSSLNSTVESYTKQDQPGSIPILTNMRGEFDFDVHLGERENSTKSPNWLTSSITKKLYTLMNKAIPFNPTFGGELVSDFTERFTIRAMAVFTSQQSLRSTVIRCPNHIAESDSTNRDFPYPDHVIRADHPHAVYEGQDGERRSVIVPLETQGDSYMPILLRFMCLGSCVGGINRRPIAVVLTLESKGRIYGRKIIRVRVCACPTRDIKSDENQMVIKETGKRIIPDTQHPKLVKKIRSLPDNDRLVLSVEGSQLIRMMLHFGESYLQCHPEYARKFPNEELREKARRYLHSPDM